MSQLMLEIADKVYDENRELLGEVDIPDQFCYAYAEAIVRECVKVAIYKSDGRISTADVAGYIAAGRSTAARLIKEHFGLQNG